MKSACTFLELFDKTAAMLKSLADFRTLPEAELAELMDGGPILITQDDEPKFVAQSVGDFEEMVQRLRKLEAIATRRSRLQCVSVTPFKR